MSIAEDLAIDMAKATTRERVKDCIVPFCLLYEEIKNEIPKLESLDKEKKLKYWNEVKDLPADQVRKILTARALYVYDLVVG